MKRFTTGASHTALMVNLASTPDRKWKVPVRIVMKKRNDVAQNKD